MTRSDRLSLPACFAIAGALVAVQALVLHLMGRVAYCTCGYVKLWEGDVWSAGNSQHISDWYTFSHLIHGFIFYVVLWLIGGRRWSVGPRFVAAVALEASWEMLENTDAVINHYRAATVSLQYYGDSIVNSVSDTLAAIAGFWLARRLPVLATVGLAVLMEVAVGIYIRDNLTLNIIMLIHPVDWIKAWQLAAHP